MHSDDKVRVTRLLSSFSESFELNYKKFIKNSFFNFALIFTKIEPSEPQFFAAFGLHKISNGG